MYERIMLKISCIDLDNFTKTFGFLILKYRHPVKLNSGLVSYFIFKL